MSRRRIATASSIVPFYTPDMNVSHRYKSKPPTDKDSTQRVVVCTICNQAIHYNSYTRHLRSKKHIDMELVTRLVKEQLKLNHT